MVVRCQHAQQVHVTCCVGNHEIWTWYGQGIVSMMLWLLWIISFVFVPMETVVTCNKRMLIWDSSCQQAVPNKYLASQLVSCNENMKLSQRKEAGNKAPAPIFRWNTKPSLFTSPYCSWTYCRTILPVKLQLLSSSFWLLL